MEYQFILRTFNNKRPQQPLLSINTIKASCMTEVINRHYDVDDIRQTPWGKSTGARDKHFHVKRSKKNPKMLNFYHQGNLQFSVERLPVKTVSSQS